MLGSPDLSLEGSEPVVLPRTPPPALPGPRGVHRPAAAVMFLFCYQLCPHFIRIRIL